MDQQALEELLADLKLGGVRYFATVGSTNDLATRWAEAGASHLSVVVADEQTQGRGRQGRQWFTPPGAALAFSVILQQLETKMIAFYTALGALAVCDTLNRVFHPALPAQVKWPNDIVAARRKLAGVLAEAHWHGDHAGPIIIGIGINVAPPSVPPAEEISFPATCVESILEASVDRWGLLHDVLSQLLAWLPALGSEAFIQTWNQRLAFRGEWVHIMFGDGQREEVQIGGLQADGSLQVRRRDGTVLNVQVGEIRLRPSIEKGI